MQAQARISDHLKIMLVDDDDTVREAVSAILERKGWKVDSYGTAEAGIEALKGGCYDAVLADVNMPGLSGITFIQMAKETSPGIPVVIITGYPSIDLAVEAMKLGAVDFIAKPFKSEELEIALRRAADHAKLIWPAGAGAEAAVSPPEMAKRRLEEKIKELSILHTISDTLDDVNDKDVIFRKTMDMAQIITGAERAFIMVIEHDERQVVVQASSGFRVEPINGRKFNMGEEPFRSIIRNRCYSYFQVSDSRLFPLVFDGERSLRRRTLLLSPLLINREVVGILGVAGKESGPELTNETLTLLLNLTAKASLKIENIALTENIFSSIIGALNSLINALDARDTYTKDHSNRVTQYALKIARSLDCPQDVFDSISFAGPLHDIGKIGIRDEILLKRASFTAEEKEIMKSHVTRGEEILRPLNLLTAEKAVVLYHHEWWDGTGYPNGLSGGDIPIAARIFSVADTFDAMTSTRPYRTALSHDIAKAEIMRCSGTQFDPDVVSAFLCSEIFNKTELDGVANG